MYLDFPEPLSPLSPSPSPVKTIRVRKQPLLRKVTGSSGEMQSPGCDDSDAIPDPRSLFTQYKDVKVTVERKTRKQKKRKRKLEVSEDAGATSPKLLSTGSSFPAVASKSSRTVVTRNHNDSVATTSKTLDSITSTTNCKNISESSHFPELVNTKNGRNSIDGISLSNIGIRSRKSVVGVLENKTTGWSTSPLTPMEQAKKQLALRQRAVNK